MTPQPSKLVCSLTATCPMNNALSCRIDGRLTGGSCSGDHVSHFNHDAQSAGRDSDFDQHLNATPSDKFHRQAADDRRPY